MTKRLEQRQSSTEACFEPVAPSPISTFEDLKREIQGLPRSRGDQQPTHFSDLVERFAVGKDAQH